MDCPKNQALKGRQNTARYVFFFWRSFRAYFYFVLTPGDTGTFSPLSSGLCSCGTYSAFAPLGLFNIPLMKNFSVKKEYLPELDLFPIQHFAYNRQHYKNLTKEFFQKSIFSCSNIAKIPVFWKLWDICEFFSEFCRITVKFYICWFTLCEILILVLKFYFWSAIFEVLL